MKIGRINGLVILKDGIKPHDWSNFSGIRNAGIFFFIKKLNVNQCVNMIIDISNMER